MLLIPLVELIVVGDMSLWPRVILQFLFEFQPTTFFNTALASFFYGNGLQCSMALRLVRVCHYAAPDDMLHQIRSLYIAWGNSHTAIHLGIYSNLRHRKFVWLNGFYGPQLEFPETPGGDNNATMTGFGIMDPTSHALPPQEDCTVVITSCLSQ